MSEGKRGKGKEKRNPRASAGKNDKKKAKAEQ